MARLGAWRLSLERLILSRLRAAVSLCMLWGRHPPSPDCAINMPHKFILGQTVEYYHLAGSMRRLEFMW